MAYSDRVWHICVAYIVIESVAYSCMVYPESVAYSDKSRDRARLIGLKTGLHDVVAAVSL